MSTQPPSDDDSLLEVIFTQLQEAMSETELDADDQIQEDLMTGIRHSLEALFGDISSLEHPQVTVVEGGKTEETSGDDKRPELHFAPDLDEEDLSEKLDGEIKPDVQVRFFKGQDRIFGHDKSPVHSAGQIVVEEGEQQLILQSSTLQLYRIHCVEGNLSIHSDQQEAILLKEGRSVDVEGQRILIESILGGIGNYNRVFR